jgi:hypothetical protein
MKGRGRRRFPRRQVLPPEAFGFQPLEKHIAADIVRELRAIGCEVSSTQQTRSSRQTEGMPDLYATHEAWGVAAWLEVKRPGGKPSKTQREWHERTRAAGVHVLVVTSAADALQQFGALPRRRRPSHDRIEYGRNGTRYFATRSLPCSLVLDHCGAQCEKRQWPTAEEVAQHDAYITALVANLNAALASRADAAHTPTEE